METKTQIKDTAKNLYVTASYKIPWYAYVLAGGIGLLTMSCIISQERSGRWAARVAKRFCRVRIGDGAWTKVT